jgi:hypothetical protein
MDKRSILFCLSGSDEVEKVLALLPVFLKNLEIFFIKKYYSWYSEKILAAALE